MSIIQPGSLDYLYHYGILDCVPYEAYSYPMPMNRMSMPVDSFHTQYYNNMPQQKQKKKIPLWLKGLASLGIIVTTAVCLIKRRK